LLIGGLSEFSRKKTRWIFWAFIFGLSVASIFDLASAFQESIKAGANEGVFRYYVYERHQEIGFIQLIILRMSYFSYGYLSQFMHPSYFAMYLLFALTLLYHLYKTKENTSRLSNFFFVMLALFFSLMIAFLQSTAGLLSLFLLILAILIIEFRFLKRIRLIVFSVGLSLLLFLMLFGNNLSEIKAREFTDDTMESLSNSSSIRMLIWKSSYSLWLENPIIGIGPADVREVLKNKLSTTNSEFESANFNMHNQFLESLIGLGSIGFITLCLIFFYIIKIASRQKNSLLAYLILIILVNFIFESMLNRQSGLFFILFFVSLLELYFKQNFLPKKSNIPT
jgi:O-antigen ligase